MFKYDEWCLWKYSWLKVKQKKESFNCFWWHDCRYYGQKQFQAIKKELLIRCRKLIISIAFITQSYFSVAKDVRLNSTHYLIKKINNRRELQNIAINHSANMDYNDFMKIYRECTKEPYNFLTIDTVLPASDLLRFRKNLFHS